MDTLFRIIDRTVDLSLAAVIGATVVAVSVGVFFRYVLNDSLGWVEEVSANGLAWLTFLGAYSCVRKSSHLSVDILPSALSQRPRALLIAANSLIACIFLVLVAYLSWKTILVVGGRPIRTVDLPRGLFLSAMPIGAALTAMALLRNIVRDIKEAWS
jgi:TRAP-type C4-dicarboxylate transport system permease small subunit